MVGKLVVIEGSDGAGKATQVRLLKKYLKNKGITHNSVSFPRYRSSFHGRFITKYLRGEYGDPLNVSPYLISLAYAMDRVTAKEMITDWLKDGSLVILDRYTPSSVAFQAAKLPLEKRAEFRRWLETTEYKANKIPKEDLVLYLYMPVEISQKLMRKRDKDDHESNVNYLNEVEKEYLLLSKRKHWVKINCIKKGKLMSKQKIHQQIVKALLKKRNYLNGKIF